MKKQKQTVRKLLGCVLAAALAVSGTAAAGWLAAPAELTVNAASSTSEAQIQALFDTSDYRMLTLASGVTKAQVTSLASAAASQSLSEDATYLIDRAVRIVNGQKIFDADREKQPDRKGDKNKTVNQKLKQRRLGYNRQSTGIWAVPGTSFHVFVKADSSDPLPKLAFLQHCGNSNQNQTIQLKAGMNTITVPLLYGTDWKVSPEFGDVVYIDNPYDETQQSANVRVYFDDGDKIPVFTKGEDSKAFRRQLAEYYKHYMAGEEGYHNITELVGDHVIADLMLGRCYDVLVNDGLDPNTTVEKWDAFFEAMEEFDGLSKEESKDINTIIKICQPYGGAFAAYGLIGIQDNGWQDAFLNGIYEWGITHELGHMMDYFYSSEQNGSFYRQYVESTNNVWSEWATVLNKTPTKNCILKTMSMIAPDNITRTWDESKKDGSYYENMYCFYDLECYHHGYWGELDDMFRASSCGNSEADAIMKSLTDGHERVAAYSSIITGVDLTYYFQKYQYISATPSAAYTNALAKFDLSSKQLKFWYYDDNSYFDTTTSNTDKNAALTIESIVNSGTTNYLTFSVPRNCTRGQLGFEIKRNGETVGFTYTGEYTDTGITSGTNYTYTVTAYDRALNAYASAQSTVTAAANKPAASVNGVEYQTLEAAINAAPTNSTVTLLRSTVITSGVSLNEKNITVIPATYTKCYYIVDKTPKNVNTFTVKNSKLTIENQPGAADETLVLCESNKTTGYSVFNVSSDSTLTLDDGVCVKNCTTYKGSVVYSDNSKVTIRGSFKRNTSKYNHMIYVGGSSSLSVVGNPIFEYNVCSNGASLIYIASAAGVLHMTGAKMYHNDCNTESGVATVFANAGMVRINGRTTFDGNMSGDLWYSSALYLKAGARAYISGNVHMSDSSTVEAENQIILDSDVTGEIKVKVPRGMDKAGFSVAYSSEPSVLSNVKYANDKYTVKVTSTNAVLKDGWSGYSTVVTKYVDSSTGKEIALPDITYYKSGDKYSVFAKDIKGYKFTGEIPAGTSGTVTSAQKVIAYKYTAVNEAEKQIRVHYYNKNGWGNVSMYAYDESVSPTAEYQGKWPGAKMYNDPVFKLYYEETNPKKDWYYAEINATKAMAIFNNYNDKDASTKVQEPDGVGTPGYTVTPGDNWIQNGNVYKTGIVKVRYESTTGDLLDAALLKGISNGTDKYHAVAKEIKGYTLKTSPSSASGTYTDTPKTLTYVYEPDAVSYEPLDNTTTVNATLLSLGSKIYLHGSASGGDGAYTYSYYYKRATAKYWTTLAENTSEGEYSITPGSTGVYSFRCVVCDGFGESSEKTFSVEIRDGKSTAFKNTSTINTTGAKPNTHIILTGSATGSSGYRYAYYYKRTTARSWFVVGTEFTTDVTSIQFTPRTAGEFNIKIDIIDKNGEIVSKQYALSISDDYKDTTTVNNSNISATTASAGTKITVNGAASGGTSPYQYAYYYKRAAANSWTVIGTEFSSSTSASVTLRKQGDYIFKVAVKDKNGGMVSKNFNVEIT